MKSSIERPGLTGRMFLASSLLAGLTLLSACASGTIDDAVPHAANSSSSQAAGAPPVSTSLGAQGTGQFPNLNLPRKGATAQFTAAEQQQKMSELAAARQATETVAAPNPAQVSADSATLSKLGQTEPETVLKQIESGQ
ncbi:MAG: hypothetical protein ACTHJV_00375 [Rhizobiaceae bacterium]